MIDVSIIIPVYNGERYIERCLQSVFRQTYNSYEIVIVDNNSSDNSYLACEKLAALNDNIVLMREMKPGPGCARNCGLTVAKGRYITFLDCDDYWECDYLEKMMDAVENGSAADLVLCGRYINEESDGKLKEAYIGKERYKKTIIQKAELERDPYTFFGHTGTRGPWCKLFKKQIIEENHILFPEDITMMEDLCFCMKYIAFCERIELIDSVLYHQVVHQDSISKSCKLDDVAVWEKVVCAVHKTLSEITNIDWKHFWNNLLVGFPMQYINIRVKQDIGVFKCANDISSFLSRGDVKAYVERYCGDSMLVKMSHSRFYIIRYIVKRRAKQIAYRLKANLK